jgi:hypothetical protein
MLEHARAIIGNAVKKQNPRGAGICGAHLPATEKRAVRSAHVEIFAMRADLRERSVRAADEVRCEFPADGMQEGGAKKPPTDGRERWGEEQDNQGNAERASHGFLIEIEILYVEWSL